MYNYEATWVAIFVSIRDFHMKEQKEFIPIFLLSFLMIKPYFQTNSQLEIGYREIKTSSLEKSKLTNHKNIMHSYLLERNGRMICVSVT